jgi:hypothetical protein
MPKAFATWNVLPHRPLEKLEPNLWRVEGDLPGGRGTRVMTLIKLASGGLIVHNAIALEEAAMKEIEAFGTPEVLIVPNGFHRLDAKVFKDRYPQLKVLAPVRARKKVEQVVAVDGTLDDAPKDGGVNVFHIDGTKGHEGAVEVRSPGGTTLVLNDVVMNMPKLGGMMGVMLSPTGRPAVPRIFRWFFVKDRPAFVAHLTKLADTGDLRRVIVSHGAMMTDRPGDQLRTAMGTLSRSST